MYKLTCIPININTFRLTPNPARQTVEYLNTFWIDILHVTRVPFWHLPALWPWWNALIATPRLVWDGHSNRMCPHPLLQSAVDSFAGNFTLTNKKEPHQPQSNGQTEWQSLLPLSLSPALCICISLSLSLSVAAVELGEMKPPSMNRNCICLQITALSETIYLYLQ